MNFCGIYYQIWLSLVANVKTESNWVTIYKNGVTTCNSYIQPYIWAQSSLSHESCSSWYDQLSLKVFTVRFSILITSRILSISIRSFSSGSCCAQPTSSEIQILTALELQIVTVSMFRWIVCTWINGEAGDQIMREPKKLKILRHRTRTGQNNGNMKCDPRNCIILILVFLQLT